MLNFRSFFFVLLCCVIHEVELKHDPPFEMTFVFKASPQGGTENYWKGNGGSSDSPGNLLVNMQSNVTKENGHQSLYFEAIAMEPNAIPNGYKLFSGVGYYKFYPSAEGYTWAQERCKKDGAHLVVLNSKEESNAIKKLYAQYQQIKDSAYAGFNDIEEEGRYVTIFGEPLSTTGFTTWANYDTSNSALRDCGGVNRQGLLTDMHCYKFGPYPFICEYDMHSY